MSGIEIEICDNQDALAIDRGQLVQTVKYVLQQMSVSKAQISLAIVDDATIRELKEKYFGVSEVTDVISFDLRDQNRQEPNGLQKTVDCDIVVNAQIAVRTARQQGGDPLAELNLYVVHGLLHQLGYDDQTDRHAEIMHKKEDQLLEELGFGKVFGGLE